MLREARGGLKATVGNMWYDISSVRRRVCMTSQDRRCALQWSVSVQVRHIIGAFEIHYQRSGEFAAQIRYMISTLEAMQHE